MPPSLHVLFTLDCPMAGPRAAPYGPADWGASARAIDGFCTAVLRSGFLPTVFATPEAAAQHAPLFEDLPSSGAEVGLLIEPPALRGAKLKHQLGAYGRDEQEAIAGESRRRFADTLGHRPLSVRSAWFSANDATFSALAAVGFRQSSLSSPGRRIPKHHADWHNAPAGPHWASATSRLAAGELELLEVPVTTDAEQRNDGVAPDLAIENGTLERWHAPLIDTLLARQDESNQAFRTLCFVTTSRYAYHDSGSRFRQTLDAVLAHLDTLESHYELVPATLAGAHALFHAQLQPESRSRVEASALHQFNSALMRQP